MQRHKVSDPTTGAEITRYVLGRLAEATMEETPFPHFVATKVFPDSVYQTLLNNFPTDEEFIQDDPVRFGMSLDEHGLQRMSDNHRLVWRDMATWLLGPEFLTGVANLFQAPLKIRFLDRPDAQLVSSASMGRSKSGFVLGPHTDMQHRVLSLVFYFAADERNWESGTSIYLPTDSDFTCPGGPHHDFGGFRKTATIRFVPNTVFGFFKTESSFHGVEPWSDPSFVRNTLQYEINDADRAAYRS